MIPTLTTPRLVLRPPRLDDFARYAAMLASPRSRYMDGPHGHDKAWAWFTNDVAHWHLFGWGALSVEVAEGGALAGQVALTRGPGFPEPELGWFLYDGFERRGYAGEAAAALRDWGFRRLATFVSYVDPDNHASRRLAERLGAKLDPDAATPGDDPTLVYRHRRPS